MIQCLNSSRYPGRHGARIAPSVHRCATSSYMRKWMSERLKRRKKPGDGSTSTKEATKAPEPLQPRFYDDEPSAAPAEVPVVQYASARRDRRQSRLPSLSRRTLQRRLSLDRGRLAVVAAAEVVAELASAAAAPAPAAEPSMADASAAEGSAAEPALAGRVPARLRRLQLCLPTLCRLKLCQPQLCRRCCDGSGIRWSRGGSRSRQQGNGCAGDRAAGIGQEFLVQAAQHSSAFERSAARTSL